MKETEISPESLLRLIILKFYSLRLVTCNRETKTAQQKYFTT